MGGTAKIELMLALKDKMSVGLNKAKKDTFKGVGEMQGKANELKIEVKNKVRTGLNQAKKDTFKGVNEIQARMNGLKSGVLKNSKAITNEVPMLGNALMLVKNPIALTVAGVLAIGKGIDYTTQKAADFNTQFRALANLNLDKSRKDVPIGCAVTPKGIGTLANYSNNKVNQLRIYPMNPNFYPDNFATSQLFLKFAVRILKSRGAWSSFLFYSVL